MLHVVKVFVASPGDVATERKLVKVVADALNQNVALFGAQRKS